MLKLLISCVLGLVMLFTIAYASPAYATSATVILTQIQAGGVGAATQELVVLYNNGPDTIDITDWCLRNKSNVKFACFERPSWDLKINLPGYSWATIVSTAYEDASLIKDYSLRYVPTNSSSGAIVGSSDDIALIDTDGAVIDSHSWSTSLAAGMVRTRSPIIGTMPLLYHVTGEATDWLTGAPLPVPPNEIYYDLRDDTCPNIDGMQFEMPTGMAVDAMGECYELPPLLPILITEVLPNAVGSDAGGEYIELYNPNDIELPLSGWIVEYGVTFDKSVKLPEGTSLPAGGYLVLSNANLNFSLGNTNGAVRLVDTSGLVISETAPYEKPKEGHAWVLIDEEWLYTSQPTPGQANVKAEVSAKEPEKAEPKPCAANQYRSLETNRCRLIATNSRTPTPCKDNQYRSEATGRCRNIAASSSPAPCKEGQERNPETNRCRNIVKMSNADYSVLGAQTESGGGTWYMWAAIGGILLLALAYTVWEWRYELSKLFDQLRRLVRLRK